ncbi:hypothetical protein P7K49_017007 [Saguinus oedipus]|uniref:Uncharacterized protein n=1 Tax=Saguinus oedipus TaxID=9490 RepID=A0ABQ9V1A7_SAGOE|nr:hypothetical protein P7K49_017007 [Saguinus oedipus]
MAGSSSLEAVRRKIRSLQEQADAAEERAGSLQRELDHERKLRETPPGAGASSPGGPAAPGKALLEAPVPDPPNPRLQGSPGAPGPAGGGLWGGARPSGRE